MVKHKKNDKKSKEKKRKLPKIVYTTQEEDWLIINVLDDKYREIIENKKIDVVTNRQKDKAWEEITNAFNVGVPGLVFSNERSLKSLREKYQKIKQTLKDRAYYISNDANGQSKKELPALSLPMQKLAAFLNPVSDINHSSLQCDSHEFTASAFSIKQIAENNDRHGESDCDMKPSFLDEVQCAVEHNVLSNAIDTSFLRGDAMTDAEVTTNQFIKSTQQVTESMSSNEDANIVDNIWEKANQAKLRKPINDLLQYRRRRNAESVIKRKTIKKSEEIQYYSTTRHQTDILINEEERQKFERQRAALDLERAALDLERAELNRDRAALDLERSTIELARAKNQLKHKKELQCLRLAAFHKEQETQKFVQTALIKEEKLEE